jgi:carboxypeptidase C (cathepsin A)
MILRNLAAALLLFVLPAFAQSGDQPATPPPADAAAASPAAAKPGEPMKNPLPADKSAPQTITIGGKTIHYTATVGTITLKGNDEKPNGVVMYTAYTLDEPKGDKGPTHRPVTFALNGGPGASSVI